MIYIIGEKKPIKTHCLKCSSFYSEKEESDDVFYKGLCSICQNKEKIYLLENYRKRFSRKSFKEITGEDPETANNRRYQQRVKRKKLTKRKR